MTGIAGSPAPSGASVVSGLSTTSRLPVQGAHVRNRYIDVLRSVALTRVVLFHLFGWAWLPLLFPSMGVMFAFAGSLMAGSLDRSTTGAGPVVRKRLRRLLPPLWAMGVIVVPIMIFAGWTSATEDAQALGPHVLAWILPVTTPRGSDLGAEWAVPLWYIRTYMWLMLISAGMLWLWRHWPRAMMVLPFVVLLLEAGQILSLDGEFADGVLSVATYAACWMIGFYHHDGRLHGYAVAKVFLVGILLILAGLGWSLVFRDPSQDPFNVSDIPMATALYNLGFTMILLRLPLTLQWVNRVPVLSHWVTLTNRRAMTIYLWGNTAIFVALWALERFNIVEGDTITWPFGVLAFAATTAVLLVIILCLGWVEDIAARRRPEILPVRSSLRPSPSYVTVGAGTASTTPQTGPDALPDISSAETTAEARTPPHPAPRRAIADTADR